MSIRAMTPEELRLFDAGKCPNCGDWKFICGPQASMMQNIYCESCGMRLNVSVGFPGGTLGQVLLEPPGYAAPVAQRWASTLKRIMKTIGRST